MKVTLFFEFTEVGFQLPYRGYVRDIVEKIHDCFIFKSVERLFYFNHMSVEYIYSVNIYKHWLCRLA